MESSEAAEGRDEGELTKLKGMLRVDILSSEVVQDQPVWHRGIAAGVLQSAHIIHYGTVSFPFISSHPEHYLAFCGGNEKKKKKKRK